MVHGACGSKCLQYGKCSKQYPKSFEVGMSFAENRRAVCRTYLTNKREETTVNLAIGGGVISLSYVGLKGVLLQE